MRTLHHASPCLVVLLAAVLFGGPAAADDLARAEAAYHRGDHAEAVAIWLPLARDGDARAQFSLGTAYFYGNGVDADHQAATRWYRASAEQGYGPAQFNLGNAYKHGRGVAPDEAAAAVWWRRAAEQDYAVAQHNLALQYYLGLGVPQDIAEARLWFQRAADNGHPRAKAVLAKLGRQRDAAPAAGDRADDTVVVDDESWVRAQDPGSYTIQLLATLDASRIAPSLTRAGFAGRVAAFRFERDDKTWLGVIHGAFADRRAATTAAGRLPAALRKSGPWVRRMSDVQALIQGR